MLKPLDLFVILKIASRKSQSWNQVQLAAELFVSQSSIHAALRSGEKSRLFSPRRRAVNKHALFEVVSAVPYFFPAELGSVARGLPTAWAAPPLASQIADSDPLPPVWPHPEGTVRGLAIEPLYETAARAASHDQDFYQLLALVDALRFGRAREKGLAANTLRETLEVT